MTLSDDEIKAFLALADQGHAICTSNPYTGKAFMLAPQFAREVLALRRTLRGLRFWHDEGCGWLSDPSRPESMCDCNAWAYKESVREALEAQQ